MFNFLTELWPRKWPSKKQWKRLPEVLDKREKIIFLLLIIATLLSFFYATSSFFLSKTERVPYYGGVYREGVVKSTRWLTINPIYSSQSEVERDLIEIVFDGLMRYDHEGNLSPNIAKGYTTEDNRVFDVELREDVLWSDGEKMTANDVIFTVKTIQSADYGSTQRQIWTGVEVEKLSDYEIRFSLENPSSIFSENLTLKPIPQHIFEDSSPREFRDSIYNIKPVSSGPYRYKEIKEGSGGDIESLKLERNPYYFRSRPLLDEVSFHFFRDTEELLRAKRRGEIDGFTLSDSSRRDVELEELNKFIHYEVALPRYFAIFFNLQSSGAVTDSSVREALRYGTDKEKLIEVALNGRGYAVNSPLLPEFYPEIENGHHEYDVKKAQDLLKEAGFEDGKREDPNPFSFTEDLKEESQGEEVRRLQECLLYLAEDDEDMYSGEVTGFFNEETKEGVNYFQEKHREEILDPQNFTSGTGMVAGGTRDKLNELCEDLFNQTLSLEITITTLDDPLLLETAQVIKDQWSLLGINVLIDKKTALDFREEAIRKRDFESLLFGTMLTGNLNPFPLWHSTRIDDPGLNLSGYESSDADKLLETIISKTGEERVEALLKLQDVILKDTPGIFLYNPYFVFSISGRINGVRERVLVNSSKRFEDIDRWYVNTKRVIKK